MSLKADEHYEDLQVGGLKIIQSVNGYRFTSDAVLLANSVKNVADKRVLELCGGSGVISILLAYKGKPRSIDCVEIQPRLADMATRSVQYCKLDNVITVHCDDLKTYNGPCYDVVVCNPPYRKLGSGERQVDPELAIARHEVACTLEEVLTACSRLTVNGGSVYIIHQASRLAELCCVAAGVKLIAKELTFIRSRAGQPPNLFIVKLNKDGKQGLIINPDIVVFDEKGNYTPTVKALYGEE